MAIIEIPVPQKNDISTLQIREKAAIKAQINQAFFLLKGTMDTLFDRVWKNPKLSPQQVFDGFGDDAAELFHIMGTIQPAMNLLLADSSTQKPPFQFTIHANGTVTVGDPTPS